MRNVSCPACGGPVSFHSTASVSAVCGFCKSTLLKTGDAVSNLGKMAQLLEDYSPIQLGSSGWYQGRDFTVIGRIQLKYSEGFWNEWYILYNDGQTAWLSDAAGQFTITELKPTQQNLPGFFELRPGQVIGIDGKPFTVSDVRSAKCIGGQGELPLSIGTGAVWQAQVVDLRHATEFVTLDYSDREKTVVYRGQSVQLGDLRFQLLRDVDAVVESSGRIKDKVNSLNCPSCGNTLKYIPGKTNHLVCGGCQSEIDTSGALSEVIAADQRMSSIKTTLELGTKINHGGRYELIGIMRRSDEEGECWTEYLFYGHPQGFVWFIETTEGWYRCKVLDDWPILLNEGEASYLANKYPLAYEYTAHVEFVVGAFSWQVKARQKVRVRDFKSGSTTLSMEITDEDVSWSASNKISPDQLKAIFGRELVSMHQREDDYDDDGKPKQSLANKMVMIMVAINFIPLIMSDGSFVLAVLTVAAVLIYVPEYFLD